MSPQETIGHYRILSKLGEGGMGAVYRAADTKLNREVAIKVLPDALAGDPDYLERFVREAQVLASLNHPNIATLHGVEDRALIMELVPGSTLAERIAEGPLPLEEALAIARQIAEALEAAHEKGIIHRDLKPANVKVTPEGVVKVLDFGLAKAADPVSPASGANSPTLTIRATQAGIILGTAGYMAPEQAAGKPVDRRADIWSFGVVLYEMLTGKMLFTGETISHTLASVLKDRIDFDAPHAPAPIRRLLARCLTRDPKERLRDIGEARIAIRDFLAHPEPEPAAVAASAPAPSKRLPWVVAAALFLGLAAALVWIFKPSPPLPMTRFSIAVEEGHEITNVGRPVLALSPDGTQLVYSADHRLFLRSLSDWQARPIAGTDSPTGAANAVFSPDGKSLAYFDTSATAIKRIPLAGGAPVTLCQTQGLTGISWTSDGLVYSDWKGVQQVSPNGGQPELLIAGTPDAYFAEPQLLPGGNAVLYTLVSTETLVLHARDVAQIVVESLKTHIRKILVRNARGGRYMPTGHLIYTQNGVLFAQSFNPRRLEVTGSAVGMIEGIRRADWATGQAAFSASGTLAYIPGPVGEGGDRKDVLALVDRNAVVTPLKVPYAAYTFPRVSRDGKRVVYQIDTDEDSSVWIYDLAGGAAPRRLTLPGSGSNRFPIWTADGERVAFQSDREGDRSIWWQRADGSGVAERLTRAEKDLSHVPDSWSPDGQTFSFTVDKGKTSEVWTYSMRDRKATVLAAEPGALLGKSAFSPDGHWVAYQLAAQPSSRLYIRPFPATATAYLAPEDYDAHHPAWSPDGKELFYVAGPSMFGSMSVTTKPSVSFGPPVRAPRSGFSTTVPANVRTYDVLPDGKHVIGVVPADQSVSGGPGYRDIRVVLNWFEDVKQRASPQ